jgi:hypothetical protein
VGLDRGLDRARLRSNLEKEVSRVAASFASVALAAGGTMPAQQIDEPVEVKMAGAAASARAFASDANAPKVSAAMQGVSDRERMAQIQQIAARVADEKLQQMQQLDAQRQAAVARLLAARRIQAWWRSRVLRRTHVPAWFWDVSPTETSAAKSVSWTEEGVTPELPSSNTQRARKQRRNRRGRRNEPADSVRQIDGGSSTFHPTADGPSAPGRAAEPRASPSTASASSGVPASAPQAHSDRPFVLPRGPNARLPDAHLPFEFRLGRKRWEAVELYDAWIRGAVLHDGDAQLAQEEEYWEDQQRDVGPGDEPRCSWEIVDYLESPQGDASRVTMLLARLGPPLMRDLDDGTVCLDARLPMASQLAKLPALGWGTTPPTARQIVQRMVARATEEFTWDKRAHGGRKSYPHKQRDYYRGAWEMADVTSNMPDVPTTGDDVVDACDYDDVDDHVHEADAAGL